ncbi:hypothetical protein CDL15_Pgr016340 [Punica granatum]|uniref:Protein kinase domain-containing protein n=1 Tax=Punica granatum TaxID=22663 RepID=A0A218W745_PUNGR|nr:hypothetical protein CDL15_Pgr016340 [Punica granatum]
MANGEESKKPERHQFPLDPTSYKILDEIGVGVSAVVYKAVCLPMDSVVVAIKSIDLDQSRADFDSVRREAKTMSLLSHPNILNAHCSFTVGRRLWVVMPFMSAGSLQSIVASSFPGGLSEPPIAVVLRDTLLALSYLHNQGHLHRDVKAGNILVDSNGSVKLADFGVSASIYESNTSQGFSCSSSSSLLMTDVTGTLYWMAPEVIHSHTGYSFKADIWSFGITAMELAHGRPPHSHLSPSKSLFMKITKRFRFSDYEKLKKDSNKKFSKAFKDMVASCLDQDPSRRPMADKLLKHPFFKNCKGSDFLVKSLLLGLPSVEERFRRTKFLHSISIHKGGEECEDDEEAGMRARRISGWNFNEDMLEFDPVFPIECAQDDSTTKPTRLTEESILKEKAAEFGVESGVSSCGGTDESSLSSPAAQVAGDDQSQGAGAQGLDREAMIGTLVVLKRSLEDEIQKVNYLIGLLGLGLGLGGEGRSSMEAGSSTSSKEEQLVMVIERLRAELEMERKRNLDLEVQMESLRRQIPKN